MKIPSYFLFLILLSVLSACSTHQKTNPNSISVEILGAEQPDSIKLVSFNNSEGGVVKKGNPYLFNFSDTIRDAFVMDVFKKVKTHSKKIFLDGEHIKIQVKIKHESLKIDTVIGSEIYYKSLVFNERLDDLNREQVNDSVVNNFLLSSIKQNLNHPFSFEVSNHFLERNQNYTSKLNDLKAVLDHQPDKLKTHALSVHRTLEELTKTEFLNLSAFKFYDRKGKVSNVNLSHKGDYLIDFWFVQCPPCVKDHKKIAAHLNLFSDNQVELIGVSIDTESDKWLNYLERNNYNWQNYRELRSDNDLVEAMNVWEFPTYILVSNSGEIKTKFYSFEEMDNYFSKL